MQRERAAPWVRRNLAESHQTSDVATFDRSVGLVGGELVECAPAHAWQTTAMEQDSTGDGTRQDSIHVEHAQDSIDVEQAEDSIDNAGRTRLLRDELTRLLEVVPKDDLGLPVPTCPGWTILDLIEHLARVYDWAANIVLGRLQGPPGREQLSRRPEGALPLDWLLDRGDRLSKALTGAGDGEARVWNFGTGRGGVAWWARRQQYETTIHRVDVEMATGCPLRPVDAPLAADILSELFEIRHLEQVPEHSFEQAGGLWIHLHATDLEGAEWTIDTSTSRVTRAHMKGDVAVRGSMWSLARWTWGRAHAGELEVFGDLAAAEAWRRSVVS